MKIKFLNSMTALLMSGICFGIGGAMIMGGVKVDHRRKEAYKTAVLKAEEREAAVQMAAKDELVIPDAYPPLAELPDMEEESIQEEKEEISWVDFGEEKALSQEEEAEEAESEDVTADEEGGENPDSPGEDSVSSN